MSHRTQQLKDRLNEALRRSRLDAALGLYEELEREEPAEPRWPHRKGDLLRRMEQEAEAVASYARAIDLYASLGFIARAVAMARVALDIDPSRVDLLGRVDPDAARRLLRDLRAAEGPQARPAAAEALVPAADSGDDELRFENAVSIELDLSELEVDVRGESAKDHFEDREERSAEQLALLPGLPLFAGLPDEALRRLAGEADLVELEDGATLIRCGDEADALFAIVEGSVRVEVPGLPADRAVVLAEGDVVGEACLLEGARRKADVTVAGRLVALRIPEPVLDGLVEAHPEVGDLLFDLLTRRVVGNLLQTSPLFAAFDPATRTEVAKLFEVRRAAEDTVLVEAGKRSDGLYILLAGELLVEPPDGPARTHRPVTILGQRSLMDHAAADFTARTTTEALLLRLPATAFNELAATYPPVLAQLAELAAQPDEQGTHGASAT